LVFVILISNFIDNDYLPFNMTHLFTLNIGGSATLKSIKGQIGSLGLGCRIFPIDESTDADFLDGNDGYFFSHLGETVLKGLWYIDGNNFGFANPENLANHKTKLPKLKMITVPQIFFSFSIHSCLYLIVFD